MGNLGREWLGLASRAVWGGVGVCVWIDGGRLRVDASQAPAQCMALCCQRLCASTTFILCSGLQGA